MLIREKVLKEYEVEVEAVLWVIMSMQGYKDEDSLVLYSMLYIYHQNDLKFTSCNSWEKY